MFSKYFIVCKVLVKAITKFKKTSSEIPTNLPNTVKISSPYLFEFGFVVCEVLRIYVLGDAGPHPPLEHLSASPGHRSYNIKGQFKMLVHLDFMWLLTLICYIMINLTCNNQTSFFQVYNNGDCCCKPWIISQ